MADIAIVIGERIRNIRKEKGLTQEALAEHAGLHNTYIGQVERGMKNLTLETLDKLVSALGISFEDVFRHILPTKAQKDLSTLNRIINRLECMSAAEQADILTVIDTMLKWKRE